MSLQAFPDSYITDAGVPVVVGAPGILANDLGSPTSATIRTPSGTYGPFHGTIVFAGDGSFTYTPSGGFKGYDRFEYKATAGGQDSNWTPVSIAVGTTSVDCGGCECQAKNVDAGVTNHGFTPFIISGSGVNYPYTWKRYLTKHITDSGHIGGTSFLNEAEITIEPRNGSYVYTQIAGDPIGDPGYGPPYVEITETTWHYHREIPEADFVEDILVELTDEAGVSSCDELVRSELLPSIDYSSLDYGKIYNLNFDNDLGMSRIDTGAVWPGDLSADSGYLSADPIIAEAAPGSCSGSDLIGTASSDLYGISVSHIKFYGKYCKQTALYTQGLSDFSYACESFGSDPCGLQEFNVDPPDLTVIDDFTIQNVNVTIFTGSEATSSSSPSPCCS